jgi:hypothetical protein
VLPNLEQNQCYYSPGFFIKKNEIGGNRLGHMLVDNFKE